MKENELGKQLADAIAKAHDRPGGREAFLLHTELATALETFVRSYAATERAGMREACATLAHVEPIPMSGTAHIQFTSGGESLESKIRKLPDSAADEAIERVKAAARLEEATQWFNELCDSTSGKCAWDWANERIAALAAAAKESKEQR